MKFFQNVDKKKSLSSLKVLKVITWYNDADYSKCTFEQKKMGEISVPNNNLVEKLLLS